MRWHLHGFFAQELEQRGLGDRRGLVGELTVAAVA